MNSTVASMRQDPDSTGSGTRLPTTAYALLGLLSFGRELSGYELKQFSDSTLRFYWSSPAMSQIYSELGRLLDHGLVDSREVDGPGSRTTTKYRINDAGLAELRGWLVTSEAEFPVLKHSVALRLLLAHLVDPGSVEAMLKTYDEQLTERRRDLAAILDGITDDETFRFPAYVAQWGLDYYAAEKRTVRRILRDLNE
ncbi:MAG: PadR family transcriptional regulator [Propionibacteriales bacterium]|nr:PadR family transcriptional regulator [Propionibacteriales bacterium]